MLKVLTPQISHRRPGPPPLHPIDPHESTRHPTREQARAVEVRVPCDAEDTNFGGPCTVRRCFDDVGWDAGRGRFLGAVALLAPLFLEVDPHL